MAGNKINPKAKGKEDKGKPNKVVTQNNEDTEDLDFSLLRKPINTSITGFAQARKIFDLATEELKELLSSECDVLYECKVCRNIFRSLANFISHKRVYCQEKFKSSEHGHFIKTATDNEIAKIIKLTEKGFQGFEKERHTKSAETDDIDNDRIPLSKDLSAIIEKLAQTKGIIESDANQEVVLQKIPGSNIAVFQNRNVHENSDTMRNEVKELDAILSRDKAVLQSDGKFIIESSKEPNDAPDSDNVIQISDDDDNDTGAILKCKICNLQFSTQKTLKFHMKYKHLESRLVYPCPDCMEIFSTSWSVYRHLFKVHRKSAAQIRRLRESIQSKAFKMNNPPAFYEKRKNNNMKSVTSQKITEEERIDQENQAWMDNMEGDGETPRCGGCGRTFERRAALAAHTHTCQPRSRALSRRQEGKKIEIQIRKDYNKEPSGLTILKPETNGPDSKILNEDTTQEPAKLANGEEKDADEEDKYINGAPMDIEDDQNSNDSEESQEKLAERTLLEEIKPEMKLPFAVQAEKSNLAAFRQRIRSEIDPNKLICKKCNNKQDSVLELYEHVADHFKWMRYACKLCNYKNYNFEKLLEHVKVVHKLKGDTEFYNSTVKAIDGTEAMIISRCLVGSEAIDETTEANETSPRSRRPSRCSSDSSRLSDDSSSSNTLKETGSRKRKMYQGKTQAKRKKDSNSNADNCDNQKEDGERLMDKLMLAVLGDKELLKSPGTSEENSSGMDDIEEKISKLQRTELAASRRPVRNKTKPKNEDFEYDLSNLLKMEAQGYRDSQTVTTAKTSQNKKKVPQEITGTYDINKDYCGALATMSKKAGDAAAAHMKTASFAIYSYQKEPRSSSIFVRPMLPKILARADKSSPKKDVIDVVNNSSVNKVTKTQEQNKDSLNKDLNNEENKQKIQELPIQSQDINNDNLPVNKAKMFKMLMENFKGEMSMIQERRKNTEEKTRITKEIDLLCKETIETEIQKKLEKNSNENDIIKPNKDVTKILANDASDSPVIEHQNDNNTAVDKTKTNIEVPAVVPIKFRPQGIDFMKNPIINKNIKDFSKAGMKTKILVIKPINKNKDGTSVLNKPLKFQTIKLKEQSQSSSNEDKSSEQVVVVKVPKVDCTISRSVSETSAVSEKTASLGKETNENNIENTNEASKESETTEPTKAETGDTVAELAKCDAPNLVSTDPEVKSCNVITSATELSTNSTELVTNETDNSEVSKTT